MLNTDKSPSAPKKLVAKKIVKVEESEPEPEETPAEPEESTTQTNEEPVVESKEEEQKQETKPTPSETQAVKKDQEKFLPEIPSHAQYLIVCGGTAAMAAFKAIRAKDPTARVFFKN